MKKTNTILIILGLLVWSIFYCYMARAQEIIVYGTTHADTIIIDSSDAIGFLWESTSSNTGHCDSHTEYGSWENSESQYTDISECTAHKWAYSKRESHPSEVVYACINCCSSPDYPIIQKRVCRNCGLHQEKTDWVRHKWVSPPPPPKSLYEIVIDSLKQ